MSAPGDNRLAVLAGEIRAADGRFRRSAREAAAAAIDAGNALIEAKTLVRHGEWLPWLRVNAAMSIRTATRYMRIARFGIEIGHVADLGMRGAEALLGKQRRRAPSPRHPGFHELLKQQLEISPWRCQEDAFSRPVRSDMVPVVLKDLALTSPDHDYDIIVFPIDLLKLLEEWRADILEDSGVRQ